jgi:hypothetical protein
MPGAPELIATAYRRFVAEIPALAKLKLVVRLELRGRGDVQVYRVELPGPQVRKEVPDDARVDISVPRSHFNELATKGRVQEWREAFEHGDVKVGGDPEIQKLVGTVIARHEARAHLRKAR